MLLQASTGLPVPAGNNYAGPALLQSDDPALCYDSASLPLSLPAVTIADQSANPSEYQMPFQPSEDGFRASPLEHASDLSFQPADGAVQALMPPRTAETLAAAGVSSRAGARSHVHHARSCGLQDLPPEVVMHILARLPMQVYSSTPKSFGKPYDLAGTSFHTQVIQQAICRAHFMLWVAH